MNHEELLRLRNEALDMTYVMPVTLGPQETYRPFEMRRQALLQFATAVDHLLSFYPENSQPMEV